MSINEYANDGCAICKAFIEKDYNNIAIGYDRSTAMLKDVEDIQQHLKAAHYKKVRYYAFTLTTNGDNVEEEETNLREATQKLYTQQSCPVKEGAAFLEYTEQGRPHIHGWYRTESGGRIFAKIFRRCWSLWGEKPGRTQFRGGYHEEVKSLERFAGYSSAEGRLVFSM